MQFTSTPQRHHLKRQLKAWTQYKLDLTFGVVEAVVLLGFIGIIGRLFYWQVMKGPELHALAQTQYSQEKTLSTQRGQIRFADGQPLVTNLTQYVLFAQPHQLSQPAEQVARALHSVLLASASAEVNTQEVYSKLLSQLSDPSKKWVALQYRVSAEQKQAVEQLKIHGLGFDPYSVRAYPEASLAAQIAGFVGKNEAGEDIGYFGIEGKFNLELMGKLGKLERETDVRGRPILLKAGKEIEAQPGRDITLTIERDLQFLLEQKLLSGITRYGAKSGEAVIMDPSTGAIMAMASFPNYSPSEFYKYPAETYKNPLISEGYEPGSTFKVLTVAAGIDAGVVSPSTECTRCAGPRTIGEYTIKTWNDEYTPRITIEQGLAKSDNTAMIFVAEQVGEKRFTEYLRRFQIGEPSGVELQEDAGTPIRERWGQIDLATASFGQGIATTGMQMMKAVSAIANDGKMMQPHTVQSVIVDGEAVRIEPKAIGQPITKSTANTVRDMMVTAAHQGEAKWAVLKDYTIAGKTGTAQIPVAGHYDEEKTMASFIGFAPAQDPRFVMLVKLREPQSSQWASETAAPLWYDIAEDLFLRMNIPPDR